MNAAQVTPQKKRSAPGTKFSLNNTCPDKKASLSNWDVVMLICNLIINGLMLIATIVGIWLANRKR
jgi:hypothetical protein